MVQERIQDVAVETVTGLAALNLGPLRLCEWLIMIVSALVLARVPVFGLAMASGSSSTGGRWSLILLLLGLLATHVAAEGTRWQMVPLYGAALLALLLLIPAGAEVWPRPLRWLASVAGLGALAASLAAAALVPLFQLVPPGGPLAVGTRLYQVTDDRRAEPHDPASGPRHLMMQLWFPAVPGSGTGAAAYRAGRSLWADGKWLRSATWPLSHQRLIATQSQAGALPLPSAKPRPVVLFAHAWGGTRIQNTALMQDLASRGYIVAAFDRPYNAAYVVFADGRQTDISDSMTLDTSSDMALKRTLALGAREAAIGAADASAVLDALAMLGRKDGGSVFAGQIAAEHAAILGHSFGGAVAAETCRTDRRFVAALNLDGWIFGGARRSGVPCLYMLMNDGDPVPPVAVLSVADPAMRNNARMQIDDQQAQLQGLIQHGGWDLTIAGASHEDFTDRPFYARLGRLTGAGSLPPGRVDAITRRYAAALVGLALEGRASPWLDAPPPGHPEINFRTWPVPGAQPLPGQVGG